LERSGYGVTAEGLKLFYRGNPPAVKTREVEVLEQAQQAMRARQQKEQDRQRRVLLNLLAKDAELGTANSSHVVMSPVSGEMASRVENRRSDCSLPVDIGLGFRRATSVRFGLVLFPVPAHRTGLADFPHPALGKDTRCYV
jgi:hypothetical protein